MDQKYNNTQNKILINLMLKEKEYIDSNLEALDFKLQQEDVQPLNEFQNEKFNDIEIDWKPILISKQKSDFKSRCLWCREKGLYPNPYSTVTDFAKFLGLSTSNPFSFEI